MRHALVIGGSGMLAQASLWLADQDYCVTVIGRNQEKLARLADKNNKIIPLSVNYYSDASFRSEIRRSIAERSPYEIVVAWIHDQEEKVLGTICSEMNRSSDRDWSLFHVLGTSSNLQDILKRIDVPPRCSYHQVQLGFAVDGGRSRWLTHDEISGGVIRSLKSGARQYVVGTLEPWSMRP